MPSLDDFVVGLKAFWLDDPNFKGSNSHLPAVSNVELRRIVDQAQYHLTRHHEGRSTNWLALGFRLRSGNFLALIQRGGLLRPSKYGFLATTIRRVASTLYEHSTLLRLTTSARSYLRSIITLAELSSGILQRQQSLLAFLQAHRYVALKGLLAAVDFLFMRGVEPDKTASTDDIAFYSKEDIAEALSLVISLFATRFGLSDQDLALLDATAVASDRYAPHLVDACVIRKFYEWEILIDALGYELAPDPRTSELVLQLPDKDLAKSLRLGYIQADMRGYVHQSEIESYRALPIKAVAQDFYKSAGQHFVEYAAEPLPRYRYHVPRVPEFFGLFSDDKIFREELFSLSLAVKDHLADFDDILKFMIYDDLTVLELLKVQRLFAFLSLYAAAHLAEILPKNRPIVFQSLVPRFDLTELLDVIGEFIPRHKANKVVSLLAWAPSSRRVFDIQYQPILALGDVATIPANILASSNIIRNSLQLVRDRIHRPGEGDPVSALTDDALKQAGWTTVTNIAYAFSGVAGELDVLTMSDAHVFVFECKNSLHPCSMHEIRTSLDHMKRASEQLTRFMALWENPGFRERLQDIIGRRLPTGATVHTCIVMGNRMFTGYRQDGHPVRSVHELIGFLAEGTVRIGNQTRRFWRGETLTADDLVAYLRDDILHRPQFDGMIPVRHRYRFGGTYVFEEVFVLDILDAAARLGFDPEALSADDRT